jgi:hypothetical protein
MFKLLLTILLGIFTVASCAASPSWIEGGLYATPQGDGTYTVLKILKLDDQGVHVRLYSNVYEASPTRIDESTLYLAGMDRKPEEALGMGHVPISRESFATWGATFVQQSSVSPDELEGYRTWLEAGGGYF